jgi:DNA-binding GntR family transcriptional regulator
VSAVDLTIDKHSKRASYLQIADKIRAAINAGEVQAREQLPSQREIEEQAEVAMKTVQKAIQLLEREHYVYTVPGRGTFVTPRNSGPS